MLCNIFFKLSTIYNDKMFQAFNLTSATCYLPLENPELNLFKEWSAFDQDGTDGYCKDNHGKEMY